MSKATIGKQIVSFFLSAMVVIAFMPLLGQQDVYAAAKAPAKVTIKSISADANTVTVKWNKAKNAKKYQVYMQTGSDGWKYWKSVKANNKNKKKFSDKLKYKLKKSGKKYKVYKKKNPYKLAKKTTARSYTYAGEYSTTYRFVLRAVNGKKTGKYSAAKSIKTEAEPATEDPTDPTDPTITTRPGKVTGLKAEVIDGIKIKLTWDKTDGAEAYSIYRSYQIGAAATWYNYTSKPKSATFTISGCKENTDYYFKVKAINSAGEGAFSDIVKITTGEAPEPQDPGPELQPGLPVNTSVSGDVITLTWEALNANATYDVFYSEDYNIGNSAETGTATTFSFKGVYGVKYYFKVHARGESSQDAKYQEVAVTIPEENDPTPPEREYVDSGKISTKEYLENYVFPDVYAKYQQYNGSNTDEFGKLKNMHRALHALCCYGFARHNRFFKKIERYGAVADSEFTPPSFVRYALGCESATMCVLYMCKQEGIEAYCFYNGHAFPILKINGFWLARSWDATLHLANPGEEENLNFNDGYYLNGNYRLGNRFTDKAIEDVFNLTSIFDLKDYGSDKFTLMNQIEWGGYTMYSGSSKSYTLTMDNCVFEPVGGDVDIITFNNEARTFSTHGTGTVTIRMTCGDWSDTFGLELTN